MNSLYREIEMEWLIELIPYLSYKNEWIYLYKIWTKNEYNNEINFHIFKVWRNIIVAKEKNIFFRKKWSETLLKNRMRQIPKKEKKQIALLELYF